MNFDPSQLAAIRRAESGHDLIITGSAGTGKTLIIGEIANRLGDYLLLTPTGKAAAQIKERTGCDACTIHRELRYDGEVFRRNEKIRCPVIVDEASMVDSWLLARLLEYSHNQIILVGDASQLEPVGAGSPFHDLIRLRKDMVVVLDVCHRATAAIHRAAIAIRAGERPLNIDNSGGEVFQLMPTGDAESTMAAILKWVKAGKYDPTQDLMLAPVYGCGEDDGGIDAINKAVKALVNPSVEPFAVGDRVLCNKNFADLDLWNGDMGRITAIDVGGNLFVKLDRSDTEIRCENEQKKEITHAYCVSVHKAQGSQARRVFFVCLNRHLRMLTRRLIYTAVTRAQKVCVVCGQLGAFYTGLNNHKMKTTIMQCLNSQKKGLP